MSERERVRIEQGAKRVRMYLAGELLLDTTRPLMVWEVPYYPAYYVPMADVRMELFVESATTSRSPSRGTATHYTIKAGGAEADDGAWRYADSPVTALRDAVRVDWSAVDLVLEEDEPVIVHPRDPHTRVDILHSSRHVQVEVDGVVVADSHTPTLLFETGLPVRYYLPLSDVRQDLLRRSPSRTQCPYKGTAEYWSLEVGDTTHPDAVWTYRAPLPEAQKIAGLVCFYNERVDLIVDGERLERPRTHFS